MKNVPRRYTTNIREYYTSACLQAVAWESSVCKQFAIQASNSKPWFEAYFTGEMHWRKRLSGCVNRI